MSLDIFGLLEEAYAQARTIDNQRQAAIEAGQKLEETVRTQSQSIIDLTRQRNKYKGTLQELDALLEDARGVIDNQGAEIASLKAQVANLAQRLDEQRSKRTAPPTGPAHGSMAIDSPYHKDNSPRN